MDIVFKFNEMSGHELQIIENILRERRQIALRCQDIYGRGSGTIDKYSIDALNHYRNIHEYTNMMNKHYGEHYKSKKDHYVLDGLELVILLEGFKIERKYTKEKIQEFKQKIYSRGVDIKLMDEIRIANSQLTFIINYLKLLEEEYGNMSDSNRNAIII